MSFPSILNAIFRQRIKPVFSSSSGPFAQQTRNTFILKRKYPLKLHPKDGKPQRFRAKNWIYEVVENTGNKPQKPIDIILTSYVEGVGNLGDKISMKPDDAYNRLLLPGLAVYASPSNIEAYKQIIAKAQSEKPAYSSIWAPRTMNVLSTLLLSVVVSKKHPWTVQKYHIRAAFRKLNIHVPDHAITMPKKEITGPDLDKQNKEFYIVVTINGREKVNVRCRLHHYTAAESERFPYCEFWKKQEPAIFPEDQPVLDSMRPHRLWERDSTASDV